MTSAFFLVGGGALAATLNLLTLGRDRPSEVATLFGLIRVAVVLIGIGSLGTLAFGLWLVPEAPGGYGFGQFWVWSAIALWALAGWAGSTGGRRDRATRLLAQRLAADGDAPSRELRARVRDPLSLALSWGSGLALLLVLLLMVWKPGH